METQLMTKEEFIKYIEENQHLETVDITVGDLNGVDIDGFIEYWHFSEDIVRNRYLKRALESYLLELEREKNRVYLAQELVSVDSTDEEYEKFKEEFFSEIGAEVKSVNKVKDALDWYRISFKDLEGEQVEKYVFIGQTKHLKEFVTDQDKRTGVYSIFIKLKADGYGFEGALVYNKNQKYFFTGEGPFEWNIIFNGIE